MSRNSPPDISDNPMLRTSHSLNPNHHGLPRIKRQPGLPHNPQMHPMTVSSNSSSTRDPFENRTLATPNAEDKFWKRLEPLRNAACNTTIMELAYAAFYTISSEKENTTDINNEKITNASSELCDKYMDLEECMLKGGEFESVREQVYDVLRDQGYQDACGSSLAFLNFVVVMMCPVVWLSQDAIIFHFR
ncbi:hypothetical protein Ddc_06740 [Ditylenchus destructor]|nr:hypothetical protein Ddc_06740 [Ditylenchus destructor]